MTPDPRGRPARDAAPGADDRETRPAAGGADYALVVPEPADPSAEVSDSAIGRRRTAARSGGAAGYEERRELIVRTAAQLFKKKGYARTTFSDIAREIGSDRASLYYYVASKDELLDAVVTDVVKANTVIAEGIRDGPGTAPEKLRELVIGIMRSFEEHYPMLYVYLQENLAHVSGDREAWAQEMRAVNRRWERAIESVIRGGIEDGTLRSTVEPRILAYGMIGMVSWTNRWFNPERTTVDAATIGEAYADMLLDGLVTAPGEAGDGTAA